jgi:uncharacterized FlgJ-related protein
MPFQDMYNNHIPQADQSQFDTLLTQAEALVQPYLRNLSEEENSKVGSIDEKGKLVVNKVMDYLQSQPALRSTDVDWAEFRSDYDSRRFYELRATRLMALAKAMLETKRLHDFDNYQNALIDYDYAKYKDRTAPGLGYDTKIEEIGQFFKNTKGGSTVADESEEL